MKGLLKLLSLTLVIACTSSCTSMSQPGDAGATRSAVLGTWRLARIDYSGPAGKLEDPFFGSDVDGLITYDANGWMSVQISRRARPEIARASNRISGFNSPQDAQAKALALDSYYAYFGTWEFDPARSIITHHVKASALPYEIGVDLVRDVALKDGQISLIAHNKVNGETRTRALVWERISTNK